MADIHRSGLPLQHVSFMYNAFTSESFKAPREKLTFSRSVVGLHGSGAVRPQWPLVTARDNPKVPTNKDRKGNSNLRCRDGSGSRSSGECNARVGKGVQGEVG